MSSQNNQLQQQLMQMSHGIGQHFEHHHHSDALDPVNKCKELIPQLKKALDKLINQLAIILNPSYENQKIFLDNQFQVLGRCVENFNRLCDLLTINLRLASEVQHIQTISSSLERQASSHLDATKRGDLCENLLNKPVNKVAEVRDILQKHMNFKYE